MVPHEQFAELCAVSLAGEVTAEERRKLVAHLEICRACRTTLEQFKLCLRATIPAAAEALPNHTREFDPPASIEQAEANFFNRFDEEGGFSGSTGNSSPRKLANGPPSWEVSPPPSGVGWGQLWMPFVTVVLFALALGIASYRTGIKRGKETALLRQRDEVAIAEQVSDSRKQSEQLRALVAEREREITKLKRHTQELLVLVRQRAATIAESEHRTDSHLAEMAAKLEDLEEQLNASEQERSRQTRRVSELEAKANELSRQLRESESTVAQQESQLENRAETINEQRDLLAHDRDVRELIGARELYVTDVYDIGKTGETNKPYGRIFYTKGKSLIFYAYDLDQEPGLPRTGTFQAWGQRGPDRQRALNLGIFYEDNPSNKRWILKSNNPETLEQIDAVFVTVEPDAHSHIPRGKQVLFAYLRINANHP